MNAAGVFAIFAAATLVYLIWQDLPWIDRPNRTAFGEVRCHRAQGGESGDTYRMVVQFADEAGNEHIFVDGVHRNFPWLPQEAVVEVIYPEGKPELARVFRPAMRRRIYVAQIAALIALIAIEFDLLPKPLASMF